MEPKVFLKAPYSDGGEFSCLGPGIILCGQLSDPLYSFATGLPYGLCFSSLFCMSSLATSEGGVGGMPSLGIA